MAASKVGHGLAKGLGINVHPVKEPPVAVPDEYIEVEPTVGGFFRNHTPTAHGVRAYIKSLFPFWNWIFHYNFTWLFGDIIAGLTVGFVVVPQGMAYALLAKLPPEYGLYTSFVGFLLYWAFATSKDITIGTVAVMSTIVGNVVIRVQAEYPQFEAEQIARGLAVIAGAILLFIGLIRAGFIVELIPLVAIAAFMTGAALNIACGQVPTLLGISGVNTRAETYSVIINTLKGLPRAKVDAAMGLTALFLLYLIRWFCAFMSVRQPQKKKFWFFMSTLRMAFVILLYTLISWLVNRRVKTASKAAFRILGNVPSGFRHAGVPNITPTLIQALAPDIPTTVIVLIIEHIAISKSFGRVNNYIINPSQELVAVGFTNVFGPFLGGYPATGSFSRTAIKSKAGVRTPFAGIFTAILVLLALYALTSVFFYIPMSSMAALIIHAVGDLITPPNTVYQFWRTSPAEVVIFFAGVLVTVFTNIENGIYLTVAASAALLALRLALSSGKLLGRVRIYRVNEDELRSGNGRLPENVAGAKTRDVYVALDHSDNSNPRIPIDHPYPGVFVYRFPEGFNYINSAKHMDNLTVQVYKETRRTLFDRFEKIGDRPWNDPGPRRGQPPPVQDHLPILRAIVLDFSSVNHVDVTSVQALLDLRTQFARYAAPAHVQWHFAGVTNRWTKRALVAAGFGFEPVVADVTDGNAKAAAPNGAPSLAIFSTAAIDDGESQVALAKTSPTSKDEESPADAGEVITAVGGVSSASEKAASRTGRKLGSLYGVNRPNFHVDIAAAVESIIAHIEDEDGAEESKGSD